MRKLIAIAGVVVAAAAAAGCGEVEATPEASRRPVKVAAVAALDTRTSIRYSAAIQANQVVPIAFNAGGYVSAVQQRRGADGRMRALQPGDLVSAGDVLARVRESDYRERVNQSQASIAELTAARDKASADLTRARALFDTQSLTRPDLDAAQASFDASEARLASSRAQATLAEIALRDTALVAPIAGVVLERRIEAGAFVGIGTVGFVVGQLSPVKAVFGVPDFLVRTLAVGRPLTVSSDAFVGDRFAGQITAVAPSADQETRVFSVEVSIDNRDLRLKPGMIGSVEVAPASLSSPAGGAAAEATGVSSAAVPLSAIVRPAGDPDGYAVFVVDGSGGEQTVRSRPVTLGEVSGNAIAVTAGLRAGEHVVVSGPSLLRDGEAVRVLP